MTKFALFIRDHGAHDLLDFHQDEASAQQAVIDYVAEKTGKVLPSDPEEASEAIKAYFDGDNTFYTIAGLPAGAD